MTVPENIDALGMAHRNVFVGALLLLICLLFLCLVRAIKGPRVSDRIVAVNMMGTMVMVIIAIMALLLNEGYLVDICLIYAMISFLAVIVLTKVYMGVYRQRKLQEMQAFEARRESAESDGTRGEVRQADGIREEAAESDGMRGEVRQADGIRKEAAESDGTRGEVRQADGIREEAAETDSTRNEACAHSERDNVSGIGDGKPGIDETAGKGGSGNA